MSFTTLSERNLRDGATLAKLKPGAPDERFARLQEVFDCELPDEFVACWKKHDGLSMDVVDIEDSDFGRFEFLSVPNILDARELILEFSDEGFGDVFEGGRSKGPVRGTYYRKSWLPFACIDETDSYFLLDFDPAEGGCVGQVIYADFQELSEREVVVPGFPQFLKRLL